MKNTALNEEGLRQIPYLSTLLVSNAAFKPKLVLEPTNDKKITICGDYFKTELIKEFKKA